MVTVIRLTQTGGPEVLTSQAVDLPRPGPGEALIEQDAVGVNYLDVTQRQGAVPIPLPSGIGLEGAGRVSAVGDGVTEVAVGERVAYVLGPIGSYASARVYPANRLIRLPDALSTQDAAAILFKGLTAHYLIKSTYRIELGTVVLLYGAAGGVGQVLARWARHLGAFVIGVVSRPESAERARQSGCNEVLVWGNGDLPAEVSRITAGRMADVVYDGLGRLTFDSSLDSLRLRGTMVSMGASTGAPEPVSLAALNKKSLFLTRPGLGAHITDLQEYHGRARDVLQTIEQGIIKPAVAKSFALSDATEAHRVLEKERLAAR